MIFWKKENYRGSKRDQWLSEIWGEEEKDK